MNHSMNFVDSLTETHTNTIEGSWNGIKMGIRPRNRVEGTLDDHLMEFMWRRKHKDRLWDALLDAIAEVHYE